MRRTTPISVQKLQAKNVAISAKPNNEGDGWLMTLLLNGLPLVAFLGVWIFLSRQMQGGAGPRDGLRQVEGEAFDRDARPRDL